MRYACTRSLGIILIPNFACFAASIAEHAHAEKSRIQSLTQSPSLFDARGMEAFALEQVAGCCEH